MAGGWVVGRFAWGGVAPLLALCACEGATRQLVPSPAEQVEGGAATGVEAISGVGLAPYRALVRATNRFGAGVETEPISVIVNGSTVTVGFDGFGFGGVVLDDPGSYSVEPAGGTAVEVSVLQTDWPGLPYPPAWTAPVADADQLVAVTGGVVAMKGSELWWAGPTTGPHRVLRTEDPLVGVAAVQIDVDGVTDLLAWTANEAYLLRGRSGGGFGWGTAFHALGLTLAGADVADLSGDNLPDLAMAWTAGDGSGVLDIWEGDGLMGFVPAEPRDLSSRPTSLQVGDATGEGLPQVTVMLDDGSWNRFVHAADLQYIPIGPFFPSSILAPRDAAFLPMEDMNRDDGDEILLANPRVSGTGRTLWLIDMAIDHNACDDGSATAICTTSFTQLDLPTAAWLSDGDVDGDLLDDLWVLNEDRTLELYKSEPDLGTSLLLAHAVVGPVTGPGPIAVSDVDRDGTADLWVAGSSIWRQWLGVLTGDPRTIWAARSPEPEFVREATHPWFARAEFDSDPSTIEFGATTTEDGKTVFKVLQYVPGSGRATSLSSREFATGEIPTDLAVCGSVAFLALGGQLYEIDATDPFHPVVSPPVGSGVTRLACGPGPSGSVVATLTNGQVVLRDRNLASVGTSPAANAKDIELVDLGGNTREVRTCATDGCGIAVVHLDGDPIVVFGDEVTMQLESGGGGSPVLDGAGRPLVGDIDHDGHEDVIGVASSGLITLHRSTGGRLGQAELLNATVPWTGTVLLMDGDDDGWDDLMTVDPAGDLVFYPSVSGPASTPGDTGDTGTP